MDDSGFAEATVTIVGLGLMGGSLAAALSATRACARVIGVARRRSTLTTARSLRFIDEGTTSLTDGVREADMVVLCTPVSDIIAKITVLGDDLKTGCVLIDVGSTKSAICQAMNRLPPGVQPLGGHPMCGKETSGLTMAEPSLYRDRVFVLTPLERTSPAALAMGRALVAAVGARELILDPERHDRLVAIISHLPYLMAVSLVNGAETLAAEDPLAWALAAGGFRDTSRVAAGSLDMMMDILTTNREAVLRALSAAQGQLEELFRALDERDWDALAGLLEAARERRLEVFR